MNTVTKNYQGHAIAYQDDGWFNATQAAAKFGKTPVEWLRLAGTIEYVSALHRQNPDMGKSHIAKKGGASGGGATWLHPKLAIHFARWLDVDFAVWCDAQIDSLVRGKDDWRKSRHAIASSTKVQAAMLEQVRAAIGKATAAHHYANEHKLINSLLTGEYKGLARESLTQYQLDFLAHFEVRNAILIGRGLPYEQRKGALKSEALDWSAKHSPMPELTPTQPQPAQPAIKAVAKAVAHE